MLRYTESSVVSNANQTYMSSSNQWGHANNQNTMSERHSSDHSESQSAESTMVEGCSIDLKDLTCKERQTMK